MTSRRVIRGMAVLLVLLLVASAADASVTAIITKAGTGQKLKGSVKWLAIEKVYEVRPEGSTVSYKLSPSEVAAIQVARPADLDTAIRNAQTGACAQAIPVLEKIMRDYTMLEHDVLAARYLAQCYMKNKAPLKAVVMCDRVMVSNPASAEDPGFAGMYWQALLETDQYSKLDKALDIAIKGPSRELAAVAQLRRGDIARQKGNLDDALIDGYLRTVVFFQAVKSVQPEALFKAAECFQEKGQHPYAEKMRKQLLSNYPQSEYARRVRAGA